MNAEPRSNGSEASQSSPLRRSNQSSIESATIRPMPAFQISKGRSDRRCSPGGSRSLQRCSTRAPMTSTTTGSPTAGSRFRATPPARPRNHRINLPPGMGRHLR